MRRFQSPVASAARMSRKNLTLGLLSIGVVMLGAIALALLGGCGDDGSPGGTHVDTTPPTVLATTPTDGAKDVNPYPVVEIRFSEAMDPTSIDTLSFYIDGVRAHSIAYDAAEHKATLYPAGIAAPATEYAVHIESGVADTSGNAMGNAISFHFTTGDLDCAHLGDRFEPNDDIASATPIELETLYPGLTSCGDSERRDYYSFEITEAKQILVTTGVGSVTPADTGHFSWEISFLREDGASYSGTGYGVVVEGRTLTNHHTFLPGTYWIRIGNQHNDAHLLLYHLKVEAIAPVPDDDYEDNDFPDEAAPIEAGLYEDLRGAYVDADYYSIHLNAGQTLTVTATEVTTTGVGYRLLITNTTGGTYTGHDGTDAHAAPAVESWTAAETGTYLIHVLWWTDNVIYNLNVEVSG